MQEVEMRDPCQLVVLCGFIGIGILFPLLPSFRGGRVPSNRYDFLPSAGACLRLPPSLPHGTHKRLAAAARQSGMENLRARA